MPATGDDDWPKILYMQTLPLAEVRARLPR